MRILSTFLVVFVSLIFASAIYGCGCTNLAPDKAFDSSKTVFLGKVIGGTEKHIRDNKDGSRLTLEAGDVTFEIEGLDMYKGMAGSRRTVIVKVPRGGTDCEPFGLVLGEKYFVYADAKEEALVAIEPPGACERIAPISAKEDIEFIRKKREAGYGTIKGYVALNTHWLESADQSFSLPAVNLNLTGPDGYSGTIPIDRYGNFEVTGLRAGAYRLTALVPHDYELTRGPEEVTIAGFVTYYSSFNAQYKSRVSGVTQDASGIGFDPHRIYLESSTRRVSYGFEHRDGSFEIEGVPPGEYLMYIDFWNEDYTETRKYYYPGTYETERATKIDVGLSDLKSGVKFTFPSEFRIRKVSGAVFGPDGKPAEAAGILRSCPKSKSSIFRPSNFNNTLTDKAGQFSIKGFEGVSYVLQFMGRDKDGTPILSPPVDVVLTKDLAGLKLKLSKQATTVGCQAPGAVPTR